MFINIILTIVIYVVLFLLLSDFEIEFNPFKIKFNALGKGIGFTFIIFGIYLISAAFYIKGYKKGISTNQNIELIKK